MDIGFSGFRKVIELGMMSRWPIHRSDGGAYGTRTRSPVFAPQPTVRGIFGDPKARLITLARRAKKRPAGAAGGFIWVGTTGVYGGFAICRAATRASSWRLRSGGCDAAVAAR